MTEILYLDGAITAGTNTFKLDPNTSIFVRPGYTAVISPFDASHECEMRTIEGVDAITGVITVNNNTPFKYAHADDAEVFILTDSDVTADARWWGALPDSASGGFDNRLAIQRMLENCRYDRARTFRAYFGPGNWGVKVTPATGGIFHDTDIFIQGAGPNQTTLYLTNDSDFGDPGDEIWMFAGRRQDGSGNNENPHLFAGPTTRAYFLDIRFAGANVENARFCYYTIQQPSYWKNVRIEGFPEYGVALGGQQTMFDNIEILGCGIGLWMKGYGEALFNGLNIENCTGHHIKLEDCKTVVINQLHLEGQPENACVYADADCIGLEFNGGIISSGGTLFEFVGGLHTINDMILNGDSEAIAVKDDLRDIERTIGSYGKLIHRYSSTPNVAFPAAPPNIHITGTSGTEIELGAHSHVLRGLVRANSVGGKAIEGMTDEGSGVFGSAGGGHGVHGESTESAGAGVYGTAFNGGKGVYAVSGDTDSAAFVLGGGREWEPTLVTTSTYTIQKSDSLLVVTTVPCVLTMPPASVSGLSVYRIVDAAGCSAASPISVYTPANLTTPLLVLTSPDTNITIFSDLSGYRTFGGFSGPQAKDSDIASLAVSKLIGPGLQYTLLSSGEVVAFTPTSGDPNAPDEFNAAVGNRIDISLEYINQMRWSLNVPSGDSGFTALCGIQYSLDNGSTWAWIDGVYGNGIRVNSTGHKSAGYVNIESAAKSATRALIRMAAFDSSGKRIDINSIHIYLK